jgi:hypothetical protein
MASGMVVPHVRAQFDKYGESAQTAWIAGRYVSPWNEERWRNSEEGSLPKNAQASTDAGTLRYSRASGDDADPADSVHVAHDPTAISGLLDRSPVIVSNRGTQL